MNLKELAKSRGTNIKRLSENCDIPASTLYAISSGDTNLDNVGIDVFLKIAHALDMSAEEPRMRVSDSEPIEESAGENKMPPKVKELVDVCSKLNDQQIDILISTARNFAVANKKDEEGNLADVERAGIVVS